MSFVYIMPFIILAVCFLLNAPIGLSMIAACVTFFVTSGQDVSLVSDIIMNSLYTNTVMIAIPLFIFTANIMNSGKVTEYMFTFAKGCVGKKRGAMAYVNVLVSLIFSGMTGSALADASGIGLMEINEMQRDGYDTPFSCAITAATATIGPIFPPSIPMVVYAMLSGTSVGSLFMGGVVPALMITVALCLYVGYISKKRDYPRGHQFTLREFLSYTLRALPALFTPVILIGGIYTGIVTSTEAGALAAVYTLLIALLAYRVLGWKNIFLAVKETVIQTAVVMSMATASMVLSYIVTSSGMSNAIATWVLSITHNKYVFLSVITVVFLFLGMLLDTQTIQYVFVPMVLPIARALGIDLVHFGVIIVLNMMIGLSSPPYGILCFVTSGLTKEPLQNIFREIWPMVLAMIVVLLLLTFIPELVLFLPKMMM